MLRHHILLVDRRHHQFHPAIAGRPVDGKRRVALAQAWMAAISDVVRWTAKAVDQKASQSMLGADQVRLGIHRPEDVVGGHAPVEAGDDRGQLLRPEQVKDRQFFGHVRSVVDRGENASTMFVPMVFHAAPDPQEREFDRSLRPGTFTEFVGQEQVRDNLRIAIEAATGREEPLDHVLLCGPPGLGKTTLAYLIAQGMAAEIVITSGPALGAPKDLAGTLTRLQRNQVLFIDEIHRLPKALEEYLYSAMEDHAIDVVLDPGPSGRSVRLGVQPFTLVGATTREGLLSAAFRSRFGIVERLEPYPSSDIEQIIVRAAKRLGVSIDDKAASMCAERSRGTPRMALRILRRVRDLAQVLEKPGIDAKTTEEGLQRLRIDHLGLEEVDRKLLRALTQRGDAIGLKTLAAMIDEAEDTLEDVLEPHLIRCGLIARTPRGRVATAITYQHLGLPEPKSKPAGPGELPFA